MFLSSKTSRIKLTLCGVLLGTRKNVESACRTEDTQYVVDVAVTKGMLLSVYDLLMSFLSRSQQGSWKILNRKLRN